MLALARRLIERTGVGGEPETIAVALADACAEARKRWPAIANHDEPFVDAIALRVEGEPDLAAALARLMLAEIYLVVACLAGDPDAHAALERLVRAESERAAARLPHGPTSEDLVQELMVKLLVASPAGGEPKLRAFVGHGALHSWLRVAATRTAISMNRRRSPVQEEDDALATMADDADDQTLAFIKSAYRAEFKRAFAEALVELPRRARTLLRLQVVDQLTFEEIASIYQVSRATAARWLADARGKLVAATHSRLRASLAIGDDELAELGRLAASNLYATLPRLLRDAEPP
jgi:RNA polymerase sigma-70 factor (ECF subfamily)